MTFIIQNFGPNLARLRIEKGVSQTQLAEDLGIGKQSISDYEKQKSYPTFANLDKIAEYFNATPTQLFGTSKEIELEKSVLESNEYSDKVSEILKAVKYIENFLETDGQYLEDLLYLTRGKQLYTEDGDELYTDPTSQKRTFHNQYEPGFIVARDKSPLELLIENKELFEQQFPAKFISEAVDQTRGWFYSLLAISTLLFNKAPYENVIVLGHVQDADGQKMSKSKGNAVDPFDALQKHGADAIRWYFYENSAPWLPNRFHDKAVTEGQRKFMGTIWNTYAFFVLYANIDDFDATKYTLEYDKLPVMDKWILSKLNTMVKTVDDNLNNYKITETARVLEDFVDELSNWYVRRCRERFWAKGMEQDKINAYMTLYTTLVTLCKAAAPMIPFMTESIYRNLVCSIDKTAPISVHLCDFPKVNEDWIDTKLEENMEDVLNAVVIGRACRNATNIKNRQPIGKMFIKAPWKLDDFFTNIIADELNVKSVEYKDDVRDFTSYTFKPQLKTLGPKYGKFLGEIRKQLSELDGNKAMDDLNNAGYITLSVNGQDIQLEKADLLIEMVQAEGYVANSDKGITVVMDTKLTPELIEEGFIRELVSKIQTMRKDAGFEVMDRINVYVSGNDKIAALMEKNAEQVKAVVLADNIIAGEAKGFTKDWNINGEDVTLGVEKQ